MIIVRVGEARRAEGGDGAVAIAEPIEDGAEREPGGGKAGRRLDRLRQDVCRGAEIAARGELDRGLVKAIADEVAGRYKQWAGVGHATLLQHDPEKWTPVLRKDHAQSKCWSANRSETIAL